MLQRCEVARTLRDAARVRASSGSALPSVLQSVITISKLPLISAILLSSLLWALPAGALPLPISPAEAAAAEAVCDYLARGPAALYERLSTDAALRSLAPADALQEIEVRAGEPQGASWTMRTARAGTAAFEVAFPSGADELVMMDMIEEKGSWKIASLRTMAEPAPKGPTPLVQPEGSALPSASSSDQKGSEPNAWELGRRDDALYAAALGRQHRRVVWLGIAMMIAAASGAGIRHSRPVVSTLVLILAAAGFASQMAVMLVRPRIEEPLPATSAPKSATAAPFLAMRPLLILRRSMTRGDLLVHTRPADPVLAEIATLWRAETVGISDRELSALPPSTTPLYELIRARAAADQGLRAEADESYRKFDRRVTAVDAFWLEQARNNVPIATTGPAQMFDTTRDADVYYVQSMLEVRMQSLGPAADDFRLAWRMQPMTRPDVIRRGVFAPLLRDPTISIPMNLYAPEEARSAAVELGQKPIAIPPEARASASGAFVRIGIARQHLDIPGGAAIAPRGTEIVQATEWERREDAEALGDFDQLVKSRLVTPSARSRATRTAEALAKHNQWPSILKLTDSIDTKSRTVPLQLLVERVRALVRMHRNDDARNLATAPAISQSTQESSADASTLVDLAELLAQAGAYDDAIATYTKIEKMKRDMDVSVRVRQLELRRFLATSRPLVTTDHFEIHCMQDVEAATAVRVGQLLEAELIRVMSRIRLAQFSRVRVNVLTWVDFSEKLTGSADILGLYDGDITIPFGGVHAFRREIVSTLTHEMTHAVIAQASNDNAPHWFQEGLARRTELVERQRNIFEDLGAQQVFSISILDAELQAWADGGAVSIAYDEAATFMRFLEDRYGEGSLNGLIASYKTGANTDEAFAAVTGKSTAEIEREFRLWGLTHTTAFVDPTPWPYDRFYSPDVDPAIREGIHWTHPKVTP